METHVTHNEVESRYELRSGDDEIGIAEYRLHDTAGGAVAEFHHTFVTPPRRDQGNAERLVAAALDDTRERGRKVRATCWYVDQFIIEHPEYADLRA